MRLSPEYVPGYEVLGPQFGKAQHNLGTIRDFALQKIKDSISNMNKSMISGIFRTVFYLIYLLFFAIVIFIPSMTYRLVIKSTSVVWFVLAPGFYESRPRLLSSHLLLDPAVWLSRIVAVFTLLSLVIHLLPQIESLKILDKFSAISPFEYLLLVKLDAIPPWGWLALVNASIAVGLFIYAARFSLLVRHSGNNPADREARRKQKRQSRLIAIAMRLQTTVVFIFFGLVLGHAALWHMASIDWLPGCVQDCLRWIYGNYLPPSMRGDTSSIGV